MDRRRRLFGDRHGDFPLDSSAAARLGSTRRRHFKRALPAHGAQLSRARALDSADRGSAGVRTYVPASLVRRLRANLTGGVASTPLNSARSAWKLQVGWRRPARRALIFRIKSKSEGKPK